MRTGHLQHGFWLALVLAATPALAVEGRYLGSVNRTEGTGGGDVMRHLYDIGGREPLPHGLDLRLRASFQYQSNLPVRDTDLLRSRLFAEVIAERWRVNAQVLPWQKNAVGSSNSRERQAQFGLHWAPARGGPQFEAGYDRLDRDLAGLRSASEDRRARAVWNRNGYGAETSVRRIDTQPSAGVGAPQRTDEWRGAAHVERGWRNLVSGAADYEGLVSKLSVRERRRTVDTQRIQGNATWTPHRKISATATAHNRWGSTEDNEFRNAPPIGERGVTAELGFRPVNGLDLRALRAYRREDAVGVDVVSDYLQLETRYRHDIWQGIGLQAGLMRAEEFAGATTDAPRSNFYGALDGRLRPGLEFRAEVRGSQVQIAGERGVRWQDLAELRTRPTAATRVDVSWRWDEAPRLAGLGQTDREWQVTAAYDPSPSTSLSGTFRRLTGEGRLTRIDQYAAMSASWRPTHRTTFSANAQRRSTEGANALASERVVGFDAAFELPSRTRLRGNFNAARTSRLPDRRAYGVSLEKTF